MKLIDWFCSRLLGKSSPIAALSFVVSEQIRRYTQTGSIMHPQSLDFISRSSLQGSFAPSHNFTYTSASPVFVISSSSHPAPDFPSPSASSAAPVFAPVTRHKRCSRNHSRLHLHTTRDPTTSSTMANLDEANEKQDQTHAANHQDQHK